VEPAEQAVEAEDGTRLRVKTLRASATRGCVIVLHGLDDHLDRYGELARFLHETGYDVVLYDQRGHGRSDGTRNHVERFSQYVADLERVRELAQAGAPRPPHLFAHSMGAVIALAAAMRHPEHWRSVIVQGFPLLPGRTIPKLLQALARALRPLVSGLRVPSGLAAEDLSHDTAVTQAYREDPMVQGSVTLGWGVEFLAALQELREGAAAITCPLLILHGEADRIARPEGSRWLAQAAGAKDRKLVLYPGLKHELHNELPAARAAVFADIAAWLERH
jgi:alpha-beta hydrolase superfamily lysophospholipase